jgi:hypothetical protein
MQVMGDLRSQGLDMHDLECRTQQAWSSTYNSPLGVLHRGKNLEEAHIFCCRLTWLHPPPPQC